MQLVQLLELHETSSMQFVHRLQGQVPVTQARLTLRAGPPSHLTCQDKQLLWFGDSHHRQGTKDHHISVHATSTFSEHLPPQIKAAVSNAYPYSIKKPHHWAHIGHLWLRKSSKVISQGCDSIREMRFVPFLTVFPAYPLLFSNKDKMV